MSGKAVSFVIPAYNEAVLIGACVDSIHAEIKRAGIEAEIIVVDNASTDGTGSIALAHGAGVVIEDRKGITRARQAGYLQARHAWIACIDADSTIPPGWFEHVRDGLDDPRVVAVSGPLRFEGLSLGARCGAALFYFVARVTHHCFGAMLQGGNCLIRKSALDAVGGFDVSIAFYGEDTRTASLLSTVGKVKYIPGMWMWSSARRLQTEGLVATTWRYVVNYFCITLCGRAFTGTHNDIRP